MTSTIVEQLAKYTSETRFEQLPSTVVMECKRIVLDSIGCALAGKDFQKGIAGRDYAKIMGGGRGDVTVMGEKDRVSVPAAVFANAELINAIDMDVVTVPGHVAPAVVAGVFAYGEMANASGKQLIEALAIGHDIGNRFGRATDNLRDTNNGQSTPPQVFGYVSPIFGATAAMMKLKSHPASVIANGIGIAACISPVNSMMSWIHHAPATTIKYTMKGALAFSAVTAACMAECGHRGDLQVLDDAEYGYPKFIGTTKWEPQHIVERLGSEWKFPAETSYKPYPHCRVFNALLDCVIKLVRDNNLKPPEIDEIQIFVESFAEKPVWVNRSINDVHDAQFSMYHGIAVAAHDIPAGKDWLDPTLIQSRSVLGLMAKITSAQHPDYIKLLTSNAASRPARVEIRSRGEIFVEEARYPKGSPSPDAQTYMTDAELIAKFRHNAKGVLSGENISRIAETVMSLEEVSDWAQVMRLVR